MAQICRCCNHKDRLKLDRQLVQGIAISTISREFNVSTDSVAHHRDHHLSRQLAQAASKSSLSQNQNMLSEIEDLITRTKKILITAEEKDQPLIALTAIREARGGYELLTKIAFQLHQCRMSEIELERLKDKEGSSEDQEEFKKSLKCLTDTELEVLLALQNKMATQDRSINALEAAGKVEIQRLNTEVDNFIPRRTRPPEKAPQCLTPKDEVTYRIRPIPPITIPGR
jgi:hypothetical protein